MTTVLRLNTHELPEALAGFDAPGTVADELLWQEVADNCATLARRRIGGWWLEPGSGDGFALLYGERSQSGMLLPAAGLRAVRAAALTAVAAKTFLALDAITVSVLGAGEAAELQVAAIAMHVPGVHHIAAHGLTSVREDVVEELRNEGIGLTIADTPADAVRGANLVVLAGPTDSGWRATPGAVIVNATGTAPHEHVLAQAGEVFVDDRRLVANTWPVAGDLGQVLAGSHPGRGTEDGVVLVDLLGTETRELWLAHQLFQAAVRQGLGARTGASAVPEEDYRGGAWTT